MDALSEALASVHMTGAIFYHAECTAPWGFRVPHLQSVAHVLAPGTERLVSYHLVTDGKAIVRFPGEDDIAVAAGDILIIPTATPIPFRTARHRPISTAALRSASSWSAI